MTQNRSSKLLTHTLDEDWKPRYQEIKNRILYQKNRQDHSLEHALSLLDQLAEFDLGRSLIKNRGLSPYWTRYLVLFPQHQKSSNLSKLEEWFLTKCPLSLATQERFLISQRMIQERLHSDMTLASIPCGFMDDLLQLNYEKTSNVKLVGIDYDVSALEHAYKNAQSFHLEEKCTFLQRDAWELGIEAAYDLIASHGLNFYEPDDDRVILLYKEFHQALKPKGYLVLSFFTPSPASNPESPWQNVNPVESLKQRIIFSDILQLKWQCYRVESLMREHLACAGFKVLNVHYDTHKLAPTLLAQKG